MVNTRLWCAKRHGEASPDSIMPVERMGNIMPPTKPPKGLQKILRGRKVDGADTAELYRNDTTWSVLQSEACL